MAEDGASNAKQAHFRTIETNNVDFASRLIMQVFGINVRIDLAAHGVDFGCRFGAAPLGTVTLLKPDVSNFCLARAMGELVKITIPLNGAYHFQCASHRSELRAEKDAGVAKPYETLQLSVKRGRALDMCIPTTGLLQRAERLADRSFEALLFERIAERLDLATPIASALSRALKSTVAEVAGFNFEGIGALASSGYEELPLNLAVANLFPGILGTLEQTQPDCGLAVIRRARDYVEAHAAEPLELSQLASDLGVSMRAMQHNFRKYFRLSPSDFVLECRLENARTRLAGPIPPTNVTSVAFDCGFTDLGRLSARYRDKFHEPPLETLLRNKRQ